MPNFITDKFIRPSLPFSDGGYDFLWEVSSKNSDYIMVKNNKSEFFITIKPKKEGLHIVKAEKISRPSQVLFLQQALEIYAKKAQCNILFSNIKSSKLKKENSIIKDLNFFADNFFVGKKNIYLEVGFGSGRHLLYQAKNNPDKLIVGIEIHKPSLEQVAKQCDILGLKNVILIDYDSRILMEFFQSNSVERIFVHFPVPWDKKPHRRVISPYFIKEALRILQDGGTLEVRTDSELYFDYTLETFIDQKSTDVRIYKNFDLEVSSKYEDRWKRLGKNIYDIVLTNHKISEKIDKITKLEFTFRCNVDRIIKNFNPKLFLGDGFFVHFEALHTNSNKIAVIKTAFGANERAEHLFIIINENSVRYFPNSVYAFSANVVAHKIIEKWLNE
ncbi:MAG: tRNA (guanosine(46)-N7)-methyltransferase TrmB [Campylobacteraceae bacterium]|jgi:tRNA (guanine-N7-)-methyltransferase|nr:tRNA (guanosine(46)-N7)-methyltransferase TrmB [Campylobacteraceae bacterium]